MTPRRIKSTDLAAVPGTAGRLTDGGHRYFMRWEAPPPLWGGRQYATRSLFVFLCPADGPQDADDMRALHLVNTGHGIGQLGVVYLFTAEACDSLDAWRDPANVGPQARAALRAGLRWVERPEAQLQTGRVVLAHGRPWKGGQAGDVLDQRLGELWDDLRAFKRRAHGYTVGHDRLWPLNVMDERVRMNHSDAFLLPSDGGAQPDAVCNAWHRLPRS